MCSLPNKPGSNSSSSFSSNDWNAPASTGWDDKSDLELFVHNKQADKQLIIKANKSFSLLSVIKQYNINWAITESYTGWTHQACCPFPDHKDHTPSFGYNSKDDRFFCFGCQKSGHAVQFIAFMENKPFVEVALKLLNKRLCDDEILSELEETLSEEKDKILLDFSNCIREFLQTYKSNPKALDYAESLTWSLDLYLDSHVFLGTVDCENLSARIAILKEYIGLFGKNG